MQQYCLFTGITILFYSYFLKLIINRLPESPLWLVVARRPSKAAAMLQNMATHNRSRVHIDEEKLAGMIDMYVNKGEKKEISFICVI